MSKRFVVYNEDRFAVLKVIVALVGYAAWCVACYCLGYYVLGPLLSS